MNEDAIGIVMPSVDASQCIECKACERVCPALNPPKYYTPRSAFAAWSTDKETRRTAASGGIASAVYKYVAGIGGFSIGAIIDSDFKVRIIPFTPHEEMAVRNSKYTFSDSQEIYEPLRKAIKFGQFVAVVGLPCQVAGYRKYLGEHENLIYIDLVCHGVAPNIYLRRHIKSLEVQLRERVHKLSFRAPEKGTANYYFTLYDGDGKILYSKRSSDGEKYNLAFHRSYSYRENCYNCHYARKERCSDITIGDYHGLGVIEPCEFLDENVSVILTNTSKGETFIKKMEQRGLVELHCRPTEEPILGDFQLQRPTLKPRERYDFEKYILRSNGDFESTIDRVIFLKSKRERAKIFRELHQRIAHKLMRILKLR